MVHLEVQTIRSYQEGRGPSDQPGALQWLLPTNPEQFRGQTVSVNCQEFRFAEQIPELQRNGIDYNHPMDVADLVSKGYVFLNRIGEGTRPIIGIVGGHDFRQKLFLTADDIRQVQSELIPERIKVQDLPLMAQDMEHLQTLSATLGQLNRIRGGLDWGPLHGDQVAAGNLIDGLSAVGVRNRLNQALTDFGIPYSIDRDLVPALGLKIKAALSDEKSPVINELRGIDLRDFAPRPGGLQFMTGARVPILTEQDPQKQYFSHNFASSLLFPYNFEKQTRINEATMYLASRGICNTADQADWSQRYMTLEQYHDIYEKRIADPDLKTAQNECIRLSQKVTDMLCAGLAELVPAVDLGPKKIFGVPIPWLRNTYSLTAADVAVLCSNSVSLRISDYPELSVRANEAWEKRDFKAWLQVRREALKRTGEND